MANRVLLNASGLKVSQPGANVLTASALQLFFSSDWNALGLVQSGNYNVNTWSGNADLKQHSGSIAFNKTHTSPPFMLIYWLQGGGLVPVAMGSGGLFGLNRSGPATTPNTMMVSFVASTTAIAVRAYYDKQASPGLPVPNVSFRYFVFDFGA